VTVPTHSRFLAKSTAFTFILTLKRRSNTHSSSAAESSKIRILLCVLLVRLSIRLTLMTKLHTLKTNTVKRQ